MAQRYTSAARAVLQFSYTNMSRHGKNSSARGGSASSGKGRRTRAEGAREYGILVRATSAIILLAAGVLLALSLFGGAGPVGDAIFHASYAIIGIGSLILPLALIGLGIYAGFGRPLFSALTVAGLVLVLVAILAFAGLFPGAEFGGKTGSWLGGMLESSFGFGGALVLLIATIAIGVAIVADIEALMVLMGGLLCSQSRRTLESRGIGV